MDGGLRPLFRKCLPTIFFTAVETGGTGRGIPDSHFCYQGSSGWIEYKVTDGWTPTVRPEQVGWILAYVRHGGRVFFAVRRRHDGGPRRGVAVDELYLIRGWAAKELKSGGIRAVPPEAVAGLWQGGPARWPWPAVLAALTA